MSYLILAAFLKVVVVLDQFTFYSDFSLSGLWMIAPAGAQLRVLIALRLG